MYRLLIASCLLLTMTAQARIEDNSFLLEEAFNQEWGVYQFIQTYQASQKTKGHEYSFGNEIPITDKTFQFSYMFTKARQDGAGAGTIGDATLNFRWQPMNKDGILLAERFGLIAPTGNVNKGSGNGVFGLEFMQAATLTVRDNVMNHWNMGFTILPNAKSLGIKKRGTLTTFTAGSSLIWLCHDNFNLLLEGLLQSGQNMLPDGSKEIGTSFTINPGARFAIDLNNKTTQIVPGISFPTEILNNRTEHSVLLYLSIEPKLY